MTIPTYVAWLKISMWTKYYVTSLPGAQSHCIKNKMSQPLCHREDIKNIYFYSFVIIGEDVIVSSTLLFPFRMKYEDRNTSLLICSIFSALSIAIKVVLKIKKMGGVFIFPSSL